MGVDLFNIAQSGLFASKKSLETTGHNIANVNTEGYSRQKIRQQTNPPVGRGHFVLGTGTIVKSIDRVHDRFIEKKLYNALTSYNYYTERNQLLDSLQYIYNEINNEGINQHINSFFNAFRELSNSPESQSAKSVVRENAKILTKNLKKFHEAIVDSFKSIDGKIANTVSDINTLTHQIGRLNIKIQEVELLHGEAGDLKDERDLHVRNLSEILDIQTYLDDKEKYVVSAKDIGTLVVANMVQELSTGNPPTDGDPFKIGTRKVYLGHKPIDYKINSGKLGAMLETRDRELTELKSKVDELAYILSHSVNAVHRKGHIGKTIPTNEKGEPLRPREEISQIDFFKAPEKIYSAAELIDLSDHVKKDLDNIVTAYEMNTPGDNRIALGIAQLQNEKLSFNGRQTLEDDYLESIGIISLTTSRNKISEEQSEGILAQIKTMKERFSGVSLDEETSNMMKYQHAYDASSKVIKTADEMFTTILSIKT